MKHQWNQPLSNLSVPAIPPAPSKCHWLERMSIAPTKSFSWNWCFCVISGDFCFCIRVSLCQRYQDRTSCFVVYKESYCLRCGPNIPHLSIGLRFACKGGDETDLTLLTQSQHAATWMEIRTIPNERGPQKHGNRGFVFVFFDVNLNVYTYMFIYTFIYYILYTYIDIYSYVYTFIYNTSLYIYMFQVPGPPPTPPAMVMVITHQPAPPCGMGGPWEGVGVIQPPTSNATGRIRWRKLISGKTSMYAERSYKDVSQDQILKTKSKK